MLINYTKSKSIDEDYSFDIEDTHNCFLKGQRNDTNITEYLGIYTTKQYLLVVEIQNQINIIMQHWESKSVYTESDIRDFLKRHDAVKTITSDTFQHQLRNILEVLNAK